MIISAHFDSNEFAQPARPHWGPDFATSVRYPEIWTDRLEQLCLVLEELRTACGNNAIAIVSGYRTVPYNDKLYMLAGKTPTDSQHSKGRAADIAVAGHPPGVVHAKLMELYQSKTIVIGGLALYVGFVHVDIRPQIPPGHLAIWAGSRTLQETI